MEEKEIKERLGRAARKKAALESSIKEKTRCPRCNHKFKLGLKKPFSYLMTTQDVDMEIKTNEIQHNISVLSAMVAELQGQIDTTVANNEMPTPSEIMRIDFYTETLRRHTDIMRAAEVLEMSKHV